MGGRYRLGVGVGGVGGGWEVGFEEAVRGRVECVGWEDGGVFDIEIEYDGWMSG